MATLSDPPESYVPYVRRRNTPAQLNALQRLFDVTPHPTRTQRQALAEETGMELKSVTNWFQNKRQTSRRKSVSFKENVPAKTRSGSKTPCVRSKISLDHIAALSERPSLTSQSHLPRVALTPRKNDSRRETPSSPLELWTHMLSSPVAPPSSPDNEGARLAVLSSRSKMLYPLEWACLKARQSKRTDEDEDGSSQRCQDGRQGAKSLMPSAAISDTVPSARPSEDVEAAITLLGFKTRS